MKESKNEGVQNLKVGVCYASAAGGLESGW